MLILWYQLRSNFEVTIQATGKISFHKLRRTWMVVIRMSSSCIIVCRFGCIMRRCIRRWLRRIAKSTMMILRRWIIWTLNGIGWSIDRLLYFAIEMNVKNDVQILITYAIQNFYHWSGVLGQIDNTFIKSIVNA